MGVNVTVVSIPLLSCSAVQLYFFNSTKMLKPRPRVEAQQIFQLWDMNAYDKNNFQVIVKPLLDVSLLDLDFINELHQVNFQTTIVVAKNEWSNNVLSIDRLINLQDMKKSTYFFNYQTGLHYWIFIYGSFSATLTKLA